MGQVWTILLAGGEGTRVRELTRGADGMPVPKQFCAFREGATLLGRTLERARAVSGLARIVPVVMDRHRRWWSREFEDLPERNVVVQSENRGTAVAVRLALARILLRDAAAAVVVLPCDHDVEDEAALHPVVVEATRAARRWPGHVVLIGVEPEEADAEYGWIVPSPRPEQPRAVLHFVEKPDAAEAARLRDGGALVSSLIAAAEGAGLADLLHSRLPELAGPAAEHLPARDFSRDLLERCVDRLRVLPAPRCGWTDLGTPHRVRRWQARRAASVRGERLPEVTADPQLQV